MKDLVVVVPSYNERENVPRLFRALREAVPDLGILLVDDNSPDGTAAVAEEIGGEIGGVEVLVREGKRGLASAYVEGFQRLLSQGVGRIVQMDADLSHDPAVLPTLLDSSADLVLGSRYVPGGGTRNWSAARRLLSRFGSLYASAWLGLPYRDLTGGFKVWQGPLLAEVLETPIQAEGYAFQVEMTWRAARLGASIEEVPILFTERVEGQSKMNRAIALEAAWLVPALRFRR